MKNYTYRTNEVRKALIKAGYTPTPKKSQEKNKKNT